MRFPPKAMVNSLPLFAVCVCRLANTLGSLLYGMEPYMEQSVLRFFSLCGNPLRKKGHMYIVQPSILLFIAAAQHEG